MIKARIRWCSCRVENILTLGKFLRLLFCFLLHSILFFISQTSYRTYNIISSYELARPIMGTIFLVRTSRWIRIAAACVAQGIIGRAKRDPHWGVQSRFRVIQVIVINRMRGLYEIYKSRDMGAKPEWQGFMNRVQTERWFITIL